MGGLSPTPSRPRRRARRGHLAWLSRASILSAKDRLSFFVRAFLSLFLSLSLVREQASERALSEVSSRQVDSPLSPRHPFAGEASFCKLAPVAAVEWVCARCSFEDLSMVSFCWIFYGLWRGWGLNKLIVHRVV